MSVTLFLSATVGLIFVSSSSGMLSQRADALVLHSGETAAFGCEVHIFVAEKSRSISPDNGMDSKWEVGCEETQQHCKDCGHQINLQTRGFNDEARSIALRCDHDSWLTPAKSVSMKSGDYEIVQCVK